VGTGTGTATCTVAYTTGSYSITASYNGDGNFTASNSAALTQTVNEAATTTALSSSPNPVVAGQQLTFTATVRAIPPGAGTPTGTVMFYAYYDGVFDPIGYMELNSSGTATITINISPDADGTYTFKAIYEGDGNFTGSKSAVLTQTVNSD
jgi:hypothetical protein